MLKTAERWYEVHVLIHCSDPSASFLGTCNTFHWEGMIVPELATEQKGPMHR